MFKKRITQLLLITSLLLATAGGAFAGEQAEERNYLPTIMPISAEIKANPFDWGEMEYPPAIPGGRPGIDFPIPSPPIAPKPEVDNIELKLISSYIETISEYIETIDISSLENMTEEEIQAMLEALKEKIMNPKANFSHFTGLVKDLHPMVDQDGNEISNSYFALVEDGAGKLVNFRLTDQTYYATEGKLEVGAQVTGYYDANLPMILIYPAQYEARVLAVKTDDHVNLHLDSFDKYQISAGNYLKYNLGEDTVIVNEAGEAYTGSLDERNLLIYYGASTRSIPAITSPDKIVVMDRMQVLVDDILIGSKDNFIQADGRVMLALRDLTQAMDYEIGWQAADKTISLGQDVKIYTGLNKFSKAGQEQDLSASLELIDGKSYLALNDLIEILDLEAVDIKDGHIKIGK